MITPIESYSWDELSGSESPQPIKVGKKDIYHRIKDCEQEKMDLQQQIDGFEKKIANQVGLVYRIENERIIKILLSIFISVFIPYPQAVLAKSPNPSTDKIQDSSNG